MYMFLFDDILLLTRVKKAPRKVLMQLVQLLYTKQTSSAFLRFVFVVFLLLIYIHALGPPL